MAKNKKRLTGMDVANGVLMKLISTGQLPLVLLLLIIAFLIYRTPQDKIGEVWVVLAQMINRKSGLGYGIGAFSTAGWAIHTKVQRRRFERECNRMSEERNKAQQPHFKKPLDSSEGGSKR